MDQSLTRVSTSAPRVQARTAHGENFGSPLTAQAFSPPLRVPTAGAKQISVVIDSDVNVTAVLRTYFASRRVEITLSSTAVTGGTPLTVNVDTSTAFGDEVELLITTAAGAAVITASIIARS